MSLGVSSDASLISFLPLFLSPIHPFLLASPPMSPSFHFEIRSYCVALTGLGLTMYTKMDLNSQSSFASVSKVPPETSITTLDMLFFS